MGDLFFKSSWCGHGRLYRPSVSRRSMLSRLPTCFVPARNNSVSQSIVLSRGYFHQPFLLRSTPEMLNCCGLFLYFFGRMYFFGADPMEFIYFILSIFSLFLLQLQTRYCAHIHFTKTLTLQPRRLRTFINFSRFEEYTNFRPKKATPPKIRFVRVAIVFGALSISKLYVQEFFF